MMTSAAIVYTEDLATGKPSPSSGPRSFRTFTAHVMGDTHSGQRSVNATHLGVGQHTHRGGSPKPKKRFSVKKPTGRKELFLQNHLLTGYNPQMFIITAYLPNEGGRRLKLQCTPGQTVQQVIETGIPEFSTTSYQVFQFPSRALLNPEKDACILQDQEISIEPLRSSSPDELGDNRLAIVKALLKTEDTYLENLRNIFDIYMEPLKKWGLPQNEMNTMFRSLSRLCDLLMNFFSELEMSVQHWNTSTTRIGGLFKQYRSFWDMYKEYSDSYFKACKLLKDKRVMDDSFHSFIELKRGAAMHTLESLMLLPVQRIFEYHKFLTQLYKITPKEHCDYSDLRYTVTSVTSIVQERENQLLLNQNKALLSRVQSRFPNDNLKLFESLDSIELQPSKRSKSVSTTPGSGPPSLTKDARKSDIFLLDQPDSGRISVRLYLTEGPVKIISGLHSHDRFLFLFDDILIIAKPVRKQKSQHKVYKRKDQLRLSEMWITDCVDEVMESVLPPNTAFVIGWPVGNYLAAFSTPDEKTLWFNQLSKNISAQRQFVQPDKVSVQIINLTKSSNNIPLWMQVHTTETVRDILQRALEALSIAVTIANCQMWVKVSKDENAYPLIGHEHPFAIQMSHNRQQMDYTGNSKPVQLQFAIKRKSVFPADPSIPRPGLRKQKFSILRYLTKRSSSENIPRKKMFKVPLQKIVVNNQLPEILQEMLIRLYSEAPQTLGIFRQSANYRKVKDFKEGIDNQERVDLTNVSIHVIAALLKELLRSVPGGILMSTRYTEFVATNDIKDVMTRVQHLKRVLHKLPDEHQLLLQYLFPLLHHIARNEEVNYMNTINLAICFSPSLLWPDSGLDVIKNEVPPLVMFMIEHSPKVFGTELPELYKQISTPSSPGVEQMEFTLDMPTMDTSSSFVPTKIEDGSETSHKRSESLDSSMSDDSLNEGKSNLLRAKKSGLTVSDSQLSTISQHEYESSMSHRISRDYMELANKSVAALRKRRDFVAPMPKRVRKIREPKRASSLRGPNDMPASSRHQQRKHREVDPSSRRKSFAAQGLTSKKKKEYIPGFQTIPDSPNVSHSSSSQDYIPQLLHIPHSQRVSSSSKYEKKETYHHPYELGHEESSRQPVQKKRCIPQHSHSFSKGSDNKPAKPISTSTSFYDRLLPREPDTNPRGRSITGNHHPLSDENREHNGSDVGWRVNSGQQVPSTLSISSSRSGSSSGSNQVAHIHTQNRPSNMSLASSSSAPSPRSLDFSAAQLEQTPLNKVDGEFFKVAISQRFGLADNTPPHHHHSAQIPAASTLYYTANTEQPERKPVPVYDTLENYHPSPKAVEPPQRKVLERQRADCMSSITADLSFSKSHSYQSFLSSQHKKDSLMSFTEEVGVDDRPESDQHLHSLPRPHTAEVVRSEKTISEEIANYPTMVSPPQMLHVGAVLETVTDHDPNKLYPSSGYNSDTESSPSRTLSRPGKIYEVMSPTKFTVVPNRYKTPNHPVDGFRHVLSPYQRQLTSQRQNQLQFQQRGSVSLDEADIIAKKQSAADSHSDYQHLSHTHNDFPTSTAEETTASSYHSQEPTNNEVENDIVAQTAETTTTQKQARPKSGDSSKIEKLVEAYGGRTKAEQEKPIIENAKVRLGLIPRTRSKSTSEKEAMRIIHKIVEEDETATKTAEEEERAEKHKLWLQNAPTSAERRKAWESLSQRQDSRSRSVRNEGSPSAVDQDFLKPVLTPEMQRRSATMPDYLATGGRSMNGGIMRTVKVMSYEVPKPERIRRINLRTAYH